MSLPCFIYARYSSLEQGRGTSLKRQLEDGRKYATERGWLIDPDREIADKGRSAFHGDNRAEGSELWSFERQVEKGYYRNGAVFLVEHFDRISRQGWEEVYGFLKLLTQNGVSVAIRKDNLFYPAGEAIEPVDIMRIVFTSEGSKGESKTKSDRSLANWKFKIEAIQNGSKAVKMGLPPAWLDRDRDTGECSLNPHRAKVLREIFDLYVEGWGLPAIVRRLNERREPTWGVGKKALGNGWNTAYLHKLLSNRAVLGEYEPMSRTHGGINETSKGLRVADFYPQAIPTDLFNKAQATRTTRRFSGGPGEAAVNNLFSGSAFCHHCGGPMYFQSQQKAGRPTNHKSKLDGRTLSYVAGVSRSYLMCNNNRRLHQCTNRSRFRYELLEPAILDAVLKVVIDDRRFTVADDVAALSANIAELERRIATKQHNLGQMREGLKARFTLTLNDLIGETEAELEQDEARLKQMQDELRRKTGAATPSEQLERVREVRTSLDSEDKQARYSARVRVKQALSQLIQVRCDNEGVATVIVGQGLMAWRFDTQGNPIGEPLDLRNQLELHHGLTSGELAENASHVDAVLRRSKEAVS